MLCFVRQRKRHQLHCVGCCVRHLMPKPKAKMYPAFCRTFCNLHLFGERTGILCSGCPGLFRQRRQPVAQRKRFSEWLLGYTPRTTLTVFFCFVFLFSTLALCSYQLQQGDSLTFSSFSSSDADVRYHSCSSCCNNLYAPHTTAAATVNDRPIDCWLRCIWWRRKTTL